MSLFAVVQHQSLFAQGNIPDGFCLRFTEGVGPVVGVEAGERGGGPGVKDVHTLSPLETKVAI